MKSNIPWSVKGIDPEAREAAKIAARRAGMTLGEWLNSLILQSGELPEGLAAQLAAEVRREDAAGGPFDDEDDSDDPSELQTRLETLSRRIESSERSSQLAVSGIDNSIERLASTIESSRRLLASGEVAAKSSVNELASRVEQLQAQLDQLTTHPRGGGGLDARTLMALEKAIAGVAGHIEKSDRRNAELVHSVETAISELTSKVTHAETASSEAISRVDISVDRLGGRIDATESEQRRSSARLNERLAQLDERLATSLVQRKSGIGAIERRLGGLETRLENVQGQIKAQIDEVRARPLVSPDAFTRKEFEDWTRRQASDQGASQATLRQSLANVEARVAVLSERTDRAQREGGGQSAAVVERTAETVVAKRLSETAESLRGELAAIGERLDSTNHTATETMQALESVLRSLTRRLETLEGRPPSKHAAFEAAPMPPTAEIEQDDTEEEELEAAPAPRAAAPSERKPATPGWVWRDEPADTPAPAQRAAETRATDRWDQISSTEEVVEVYEPDTAALGTDEDAREEDRRAFDDDREDGEADRGVDLSKLVFNLDGARDRQPDVEPARSEPTRSEPARNEFLPFDQPEERAEPRAEDNSWLEQARRAAKAAGPADRSADYGEERQTGNRSRLYIIIAIVVAAIGAGVLIWSWISSHRKPEEPTTPQSTVQGPVSPTGKAPEQKPPATDNRNVAPGTAAPPTAPEDILAPREGDVGPALPNDAKSDAETAPPAEVATAPVQPPASAPKQTPEEALKDAADSGNPRAQFAYAMSLKDKTQASEYLKKAAGQGLVIAQGRLGEWYEHGTGLPASETEAAKWYARAAQGGHVQSMHNFGYFNAAGMGGLKKDGAAAEKWFRRAAERGLTQSQVNLAIVLYDKENFPAPADSSPAARLQDAYFWAAVAAAHGDPGAEDLRKTIASAENYSAEVRADVASKVETWKPQSLDAIANGGFDQSGQSFLPAAQQTPLGKSELIQIQQMLKELGYFKGAADGKTGPELEQAIKAYQGAFKVPINGAADQTLLEALKVSTATH